MRPSITSIGRALVAFAIVVTATVAVTSAGGAQSSGCPSVGNDFASTGPFSVTVESSASHIYYTPSDLGSQGCETHPVILWGNGTFASPWFYDGYLRHLASHGFIVAAARTGFAGSGTQMVAGLDNLTSFNDDSTSRYYQRVDLGNVGAAGHSQGGGGAINAGKDSRVSVIFPLQPTSTNQESLTATAIYFAGGKDIIIKARSVYALYQDVGDSQPAAYAELAGAGHLAPLGSGGGFRGPSTAWARWQLMGDADAAQEFVGDDCGLCVARQWVYEHNSRLGTPDAR